ncbi:hypothetical protein [Sphingobium sp. CFD-1]|uniref:hypothetical protein n=1 Tax=Sphingobium sp. CFD-1 TaxID=2878545 RepID=UPI00214B9355|nr:hypothetical protein [Sphingobium sp. CFD-1]
MKSLLEQLPSIVAEGKKEAERVIERAESNYRLGLQTRELVIPSKDTDWKNLFSGVKNTPTDHVSRLIYGDNLLAIAALLAGTEENESLRGKIDGSVAKIVKLEHAWRRLDGRNDDGFQVAPFPG